MDSGNSTGVPSVTAHLDAAQTDVAVAQDAIANNPAAAYRKAHDAARASQIASILLDHASLLKSIEVASTSQPDASSTASTTLSATVSASTTLPAQHRVASTSTSTLSSESTVSPKETTTVRMKIQSLFNTLEGK
jgi:hypothetical protein